MNAQFKLCCSLLQHFITHALKQKTGIKIGSRLDNKRGNKSIFLVILKKAFLTISNNIRKDLGRKIINPSGGYPLDPLRFVGNERRDPVDL